MARFGGRAIGPLLVLSVFALFRLVHSFSQSTRISLGFPAESAFLAVFAALAFSRGAVPTMTLPALRLPYGLWAALIILIVGVYTEAVYTFGVGDAVSVDWDLAACLAGIVLVAGLALPSVVRRLAAAAMTASLSLGFAIVAIGALLINVELKGEQTFLEFGLSRAEPLLLVLCFVLPAMGTVRWPSLIAILVFCYLTGTAVTSMSASGWAAIAQEQEVINVFEIGFGDRNWSVLIDGVCLVVLGAIIAPFWQQWPIERLRTPSTTLGLALILALQFVGLATTGHSEFQAFVLGGTAFVAGLVWRVRGAVAAPILIQLCCFLSYTIPNESFPEFATTDLINLGIVTFPFAFFGMLANRYRAAVTA